MYNLWTYNLHFGIKNLSTGKMMLFEKTMQINAKKKGEKIIHDYFYVIHFKNLEIPLLFKKGSSFMLTYSINIPFLVIVSF